MALSNVGVNVYAALSRCIRNAYYGAPLSSPKAPLTLNAETIDSVNAAGSGVVALIGANASDQVVLAGGLVNLGAAGGIARLITNQTTKTIVDGSATSLFDVACLASGMSGGAFHYVIEASDGTDFQALSGLVHYACVNKAATLTLTITDLSTVNAKAVSAGTLTLAWTFVTGTLKGTVKLTPTGSLTETTYRITYTVLPIVGAVTIL